MVEPSAAPSPAPGTGAQGAGGPPGATGRRPTVFPGFSEMAQRCALARQLVACRVDLGLSQTEVAARMKTSQSAVARLESGSSDVRLSTLERYATALGRRLAWRLEVGGDPGAK